MKEEISLKIRVGGDRDISIRFDTYQGKPSYVVWDRSTGHGYTTLSAAMAAIKEEYGSYRLLSIDTKEVSNYSFSSDIKE